MSRKKRDTRAMAKRVARLGVGTLGALSLASAASAGIDPSASSPREAVEIQAGIFDLIEEEVADVSLGSFYVFDKENPGGFRPDTWREARPRNVKCCCARGYRCGWGGCTCSDIRLKCDIVELKRLDSGIGLYRFRYKGERRLYVGVMAQEVAAVRPDAVVLGSDGYFRVYYDRLGIPFETWTAYRRRGGQGARAHARPSRARRRARALVMDNKIGDRTTEQRFHG